MHWTTLNELADPNGLVRLPDTRARGIDVRWMNRRLAEESLTEVQPNVVTTALRQLGWRAHLSAALWSLGQPVAASGITALRLHGLEVPGRLLPIHVVVRRGRRHDSLDSSVARSHETRTWRDEDHVEVAGHLCEVVPRALVSCAARTRQDEIAAVKWLRPVVSDAIMGGHTTVGEITDHLTLAGPILGRRVIWRVLEDLDPASAAANSRPELHLFNLYVEAGLPRPVLNHPVLDPSNGRLIGKVDIAWPDLMRGVELDSLRHHLGVKAGTYDTMRQQLLEDVAGWRIRRFWTWQVRDNPTTVIRQTARFLGL